MKSFIVYYEPYFERLEIAETALIAAENEAKAREYFKAVYQQRILRIEPIKQI